MFLANVQVKLGIITLAIDSSDLEGYDDAYDYMESNYVDQYVCSIVLTEEAASNIKNGPFADNDFEVQGNRLAFELVQDNFELVETEDTDDGYLNITYKLAPSFYVLVDAENQEEAMRICLKELPDMLKVIEGSTQDFYDFEDLTVLDVSVAK